MRGTDGFADELPKSARSCRSLGSELYFSVMSTLAEIWRDDPRLRALLDDAWRDREFAIWYERPLLLAAALHEMALARPADHPLAAAYPTCGGDPARLERSRLTDALELLAADAEGRDFLRSGYVQTNETSRGVAWLWPVATLAAALPAEIALYDLGCSAGLNLVAERLWMTGTIRWTDASGAPLKLEPLPRIARRRGYDRAPVDLGSERAVLRLRATVWPDDRVRHERLERALAVARELRARGELELVTSQLIDVPARIRADHKGRDRAAVIYHTVTFDYLAGPEREELERRLGELLLELPPRSLWVGLESVRPPRPAPSFEIRARWNRDGELVEERLALSAPHPLALEIDAAAVDRLTGPALRLY